MHACLPWNVWKSQHDVILPYEKFEATRGMLAPSLMVNPSIISHGFNLTLVEYEISYGES